MVPLLEYLDMSRLVRNVRLLQSGVALEGLNVSNEGVAEIWDAFKGFITNNPKKPILSNGQYDQNGLNNGSSTKLRNAIDKFYSNDSWLNKQTFVDGNIKFDDISNAFVLNDKVITDPIKNHEDSIQEMIKVGKILNTRFKNISLEADDIIGGAIDKLAKSNNNEKVEILNEAIRNANALDIDLSDIKDVNLVGNLTLRVVDNKKKATSPWMHRFAIDTEPNEKAAKVTKELPALTKDQVKEAAANMIGLLSGPMFLYTFDKGCQWMSTKHAYEIAKDLRVDTGYITDLLRKWDVSHVYRTFDYCQIVLERDKLIRGYLKMIERSIV